MAPIEKDAGVLTLEEQINLRVKVGFQDPNRIPDREQTPESKRLDFAKFLAHKGRRRIGDDTPAMEPEGIIIAIDKAAVYGELLLNESITSPFKAFKRRVDRGELFDGTQRNTAAWINRAKRASPGAK